MDTTAAEKAVESVKTEDAVTQANEVSSSSGGIYLFGGAVLVIIGGGVFYMMGGARWVQRELNKRTGRGKYRKVNGQDLDAW